MVKALELTGQKFGRFTVVERVENSKTGQSRWLCICECGTTKAVVSNSLKRGHTVSCGCKNREDIGNLNKSHDMTGSREYNSWRGMKSRCNNPKDTHYIFYGERGIYYDESWESFISFYADMGNCPEDHQLDRIDVNKNYNKENCRWVDKSVQAYNIRKKSNNTSGRTGVQKRPNGKFYASIKVNKKYIFLGAHTDYESAVNAREEAELLYYGKVKE